MSRINITFNLNKTVKQILLGELLVGILDCSDQNINAEIQNDGSTILMRVIAIEENHAEITTGRPVILQCKSLRIYRKIRKKWIMIGSATINLQ